MTTRIAIFRMSALGDCLMVLPAIRAIQAELADASITWIIEQSLVPLFEREPGIEFLAIKKPRSISEYRALKSQLSKQDFDILLAMQASLRSNLVYPLIKADRKLGFDKKRGRELHGLFVNERIPEKKEHLLEGFMAFAKQLAPNVASPENYMQPLTLNHSDQAWVEEKLKTFKGSRILALNPAASKIERCCSVDTYQYLIGEASSLGFDVVLTGGPADWERKLASHIAEGLGVLNLVGATSLARLAALYSQVDAVVAPDTGPAHLADLMGAKVIGLYAVAPPELTGPYQNLDRVVDRYPVVLKELLNKELEEVKWGQRVHHAEAMSFFEKDALKQALQAL